MPGAGQGSVDAHMHALHPGFFKGPDQVSSIPDSPSRNLQKTGHAVCAQLAGVRGAGKL